MWAGGGQRKWGRARPVSLLRLSLLRLPDSKLLFSGEFPTALGSPPLKINIVLESNPLKSRI